MVDSSRDGILMKYARKNSILIFVKKKIDKSYTDTRLNPCGLSETWEKEYIL